MTAELGQFLRNLSEDPATKAAFKKDPAGTMTAAGLSDEDKQAVLSRDPAKIRAALTGVRSEPVPVTIVINELE